VTDEANSIGREHEEFADSDGAYVLGSLSPADRVAFERHLEHGDRCQAQVTDLMVLPELLALVSAIAYAEPAAPALDPVVPLLNAIRARRRRRRLVAITAAALAAACLVTVTTLVVQTPSQSTAVATNQLALTALVTSPVRATAEVTDVTWGTSIKLHCTYDAASSYLPGEWYSLTVESRAGQSMTLGTWHVVPGKTMTFPAGTALHKGDIKTITIDSGDGKALLQLQL
jgi:hypothetical protein